MPPSLLQFHWAIIHSFIIYCVLGTGSMIETWLIKMNRLSLQKAMESDGVESSPILATYQL